MLTFLVHPLRLRWGEGDISESYSADRISEGKPIRKPFGWGNMPWVCVALAGENAATAYRLIHLGFLKGEPIAYGERAADGDWARNDPKGFYHGMTVRHRERPMVLRGPPVLFAVTAEWEERENEH